MDSLVPMVGDEWKVPLLPIQYQWCYQLAYYSDVLKTIIKVITDECFRNGIYVKPNFVCKCIKCGSTFEEVIDICPECGGECRRPDGEQEKILLKWLDEPVNSFNEKLINVLKQIDTDINICYTPEHEVLTREGWKYVKDITLEDEVASINPDTGEIEFVKPVDKQEIEYDGELVTFESETMSFRVTPEHLLVVAPRRKKDKIKRVKASEMYGKKSFVTPRFVNWKGDDREWIEIDEYDAGKYASKEMRFREKKRIRTEELVKFIGWYISEGSILKINKGRYNGVRIYQSEVNKDKVDDIIRIIKNMGYEPKVYERMQKGTVGDREYKMYEIRIQDTQFGTWIYKNFGDGCEGKHLPNWFKNLDKRYLKMFIEEAVKGDGCITKYKTMIYVTKSKRLAEDMFEVSLKAGYIPSLRERDGVYYVTIGVKKKYAGYEYGKWSKEYYKGYVYDITLPKNHIMLIRRYGKVFWGSNCDNGYLVLIKSYFFDEDGKLIGAEVREVVRGSPIRMRLMMSKYGLGRDEQGNYLYTCVEHRSDLYRKREKGVYFCPKCGKQLLPAWYGMEGKMGKRVYYVKGEVYHLKRWSNVQGYGFPVVLTVFMKVMTLIKMDRHMLLSYTLMRPPKGLLILRGRRDAIHRAWEYLMTKARENPNFIYPLAVEGEEKSKRIAEFIDFSLKPEEMQYIQVREEFRRTIGCYDEETEVLIRGKGFVKYTEIEKGDEVLSYDKETGKLEWKKVEDVYVFDYEGDMYHLKTRSYDLLVSPEHRLIFYREKDWGVVEKRVGVEKGLRGYYPQAGKDWKGNEFEGIEVVVGRDKRKVKIDGELLMKFAGLYVAEGYRSKDKYYKVAITQTKNGRWNEVKNIMDRLKECGVNYYTMGKGDDEHNFIINSKELHEWIGQFGDGAKEKRIPQWVKDLDKKYLEAFIEGYWIGDGCYRTYGGKGKVMRFATMSKRLADDLQEVLIKLGYSANVYKRKDGSYSIDTRIRLDGGKKWYSCIRKENIKKVKYKGKIWDINIGGGYFVVRRNGRVAISGNSVYGVLPLFQGDLSVGTGLNNEGLQITVTNRTVELSQSVWNEALRWLTKQLGITDYVLELRPHEEKDLKAQLERNEMRIRLAQMMMQMGYDVELYEGADGIEFRFKKKEIDEEEQEGLEGINFADDLMEEKGILDEIEKELGVAGEPDKGKKLRRRNEGMGYSGEPVIKDALSSSSSGTVNVVYGRRKKEVDKE